MKLDISYYIWNYSFPTSLLPLFPLLYSSVANSHKCLFWTKNNFSFLPSWFILHCLYCRPDPSMWQLSPNATIFIQIYTKNTTTSSHPSLPYLRLVNLPPDGLLQPETFLPYTEDRLSGLCKTVPHPPP